MYIEEEVIFEKVKKIKIKEGNKYDHKDYMHNGNLIYDL